MSEVRQHIFLEEVNRILSLAKEKGITMRLLGAIAIRIHSETATKMARSRPLSDLDFVAYKKDSEKIEALLTSLGYEPSRTFNMLHGNERLMFYGLNGGFKVDVWLEVFRMAHTFNFRNRLELDSSTLPLADLLMTKLQIVELNEKDARDIVCLLVDHDLSQSDEKEKINISRLIDECRRSWGVYKTFTVNLRRIKELTPNYLDGNSSERVLDRIKRIEDSLEAAPKTLAWKARARIGENRQWYETPDVR